MVSQLFAEWWQYPLGRNKLWAIADLTSHVHSKKISGIAEQENSILLMLFRPLDRKLIKFKLIYLIVLPVFSFSYQVYEFVIRFLGRPLLQLIVCSSDF